MQNYENIRNEIKRLQEQNKSFQISIEEFFQEDTARQGEGERDVYSEKTIKKFKNRIKETRCE